MGIKLTETGFNDFNQSRFEPQWLKDIRIDSWNRFQEIPFPTTRDEVWRKTDIRSFHLQNYELNSSASNSIKSFSDLPNSIKTLIDNEQKSNGIRVLLDGFLEYSFKNKILSTDIIFESINEALQNHPNLLRKYFLQGIKIDENKFTALTGAFINNGILIHIPPNTQVEFPLYSINLAGISRNAIISNLLVIMEENSELNLIQYSGNITEDADTFHSGVQEIFMKPGAHLRLVEIQDWNQKSWHFSSQRAFLERDAQMEWITVGTGGKVAKSYINTQLQGPGSRVDLLGLIHTSDKQLIDYHTLQNHEAPHTTSDLLYNTVLHDKSRSVFRGMILVNPIAQKTDAYQRNNNLILSAEAHADSVPGLEILANDVRCTHGSTTGEIDREQIFYLMSRGISHGEAERLIIEGFFETVLERIKNDKIQMKLRDFIFSKLNKYDR